MKMILAIVQADDALAITDALVTAGYRVTRIATTGGWLRRENATLMLGVEDAQVNHVLRLLQRVGRERTTYVDMPVERQGTQNPQASESSVQVGSATVFVLDVEHSDRY
jgi:uncharacterized protein YaaQ